jgi:hypothetical protein
VTPNPIVPNPGSELNPANFVGRHETTEQALTMLRSGQRILLSDPRRMGKTFWMVAFATQVSKEFQVILIDYQGVTSIDEFLTRTAQKLAGTTRSTEFRHYLRGLFENVELDVSKGPVTLKKEFKSQEPLRILENILTQLDSNLSKSSKSIPVVIAMDEVPDAVMSIAESDPQNGPQAGKNLLQKLRALRNSTRNIDWIMAGSIGFHHVLPTCGTTENVINDMTSLSFGPLNEADAAELTQRLAMGVNRPIDANAVDEMSRRTDGIPYLIQALADTMRTGSGPITLSEIRESFTAFVEDRDQSKAVTHFVTRIETYYGENSKLAHQLLKWSASQPAIWRPVFEIPDSIKAQDAFSEVFNHLVDDHYLITRRANGHREFMWRYPVILQIYRARKNIEV